MPEASKKEAVGWLSTLLAIALLIILASAYIFWQPTESSYSNQLVQLIKAVIPNLIAALITVVAVYFAFTRKGIKWDRTGTERIDYGKIAELVDQASEKRSPNGPSSALSVKKILSEGNHYYANSVIILLEKSDAVDTDQMLTLCARVNGFDEPICIIRIDAFTHGPRHPQAVVVESLSDTDLSTYLGSVADLGNLVAKPEITWRQHHGK